MPYEKALKALVLADAGVAALIGTRFYPLVIPQDTVLPACAYQLLTTGRDYTHEGQCEFTEPRIQVTISANSYVEAKAVAAALRPVLSSFSGVISGETVQGIFLENEYDGYAFGSEIKTVRQDYCLQYKEL
ncbi:MAG: DUF3168 domain-containing protein [Anaerolineaceae bacterium]|nr:DUF3168 domain-containing protein [Anaerolineaceae bacterium]